MLSVSFNNHTYHSDSTIDRSVAEVTPVINWQIEPSTLYTLVIYKPIDTTGNIFIHLLEINIPQAEIILSYKPPDYDQRLIFDVYSQESSLSGKNNTTRQFNLNEIVRSGRLNLKYRLSFIIPSSSASPLIHGDRVMQQTLLESQYQPDLRDPSSPASPPINDDQVMQQTLLAPQHQPVQLSSRPYLSKTEISSTYTGLPRPDIELNIGENRIIGQGQWLAGPTQYQGQTYTVLKKLGQGAFGAVYKIRINATNQLAAAKFILIPDHVVLNIIKNEISVLNYLADLSACQNGYVPCFYGSEIFMNKNHYAIIYMEFIDGPNLTDYVQKYYPNSTVPPTTLAKLMNDVIESLKYMYSLGLTHADIKPDNIIIRTVGQTHQIKAVTLVDLGLTCLNRFNQFSIRQLSSIKTCKASQSGTPTFMAPEFFVDDLQYDPLKADLYAVGVSFYFVIERTYPYSYDNTNIYKSLSQMYNSGIIPRLKSCYVYPTVLSEITSLFNSIIDGFLIYDPSERFGFDQYQSYYLQIKSIFRS